MNPSKRLLRVLRSINPEFGSCGVSFQHRVRGVPVPPWYA